MEIQFLGTGAGVPAKHRNVSSVALKLLEERNAVWLFDCGEGTQLQILHTNIRPRKIEKIFITHLHGDHIFGLPGLLSSRSFQAGTTPLDLYGPKGIKEFVQTCLKISGTRFSYTIRYHEIETSGCIFNDSTFSVYAEKLDHGIISFGYRIVEHDHEGELLVDKLQALNIPSGPLYGQLKKGKDVVLENGQRLYSKAFIGKKRKGRIITIFGDTRPTKQSIGLAEHADVMIHESTFGKGEEKLAKNYFHSTNMQAAQIAKKAHVKQLLLTHISARYLAKDVVQLQKDAQELFSFTQVAKDLDTFVIPLKERKDDEDEKGPDQ